MRRSGQSLILFLSITLFFASLSYAQSQQVTNGLNYLFTSQNPDGSWNGTLNRGPFSATVNVIETLSVLRQQSTPTYSNAVLWLQAQDLRITEQLSDRINTLSAAGTDRDLMVSYIDSETRAWGGYASYDVNNLDTALAIGALRKINYQDQDLIYSAVSYLISMQNADGGWGFKQGMDSELYYTTSIINILQQMQQTPAISASIQKALAYRVTSQNTGT